MAFFDRLVQETAALPGVERVAAMSGLPPNRRVNANDMEFEGLERTPDGPPHNVDYWQFITTDYFATMQIPVVEGRLYTAADADVSQPVAVVNETMAKTFWPDENAIGKRVRPSNPQIPWFTVVGIVKDVKQGGLGEETGTEIYFHLPQAVAIGFFPRSMNVVMRTTPPPETLAATRSTHRCRWLICNGVRHHTISSDRRERQRHHGEDREQ